ncbi:MAG: hypothetical protein OEW80_06305 [Gemmatimonadota bacterium]|nr:hypothetical protein [Gemmatimonadota bacterium]
MLTALDVSPVAVTVATGDSALFQVLGRLSDGSTASVAVDWTATGGVITPAGMYHAGPAAGAFRAIATTGDGKHADTSGVTISATPVPVTLTSVTVTPALDTVLPGATQLFAASGHYSNGFTDTVTVAWAATGGTITSGGLYQAGGVAGAYRVIATAALAARADTAQVVVPDTATPGGTLLFTETFEDASVGSRGWYDNTNPVITTAEHYTGAGALQMAWKAGGTKPVQGGSLRHKITPTDRVYVRYYVKYSANYVGSGVNYHPHEFHVVTNEDGDYIGPSLTHLTTYIEQIYQNGGIPRLAITDAANIDSTRINVDLTNVTEQRAAAGCNGNTDGYPTNCYRSGEWYNEKGWKAAQPMFTTTAGSPGYKNAWHKVEAYFQLNTIAGGKGQTDGIAQYWFDGQLVIDKRNVLFRTGVHPTMQFNQFIIAPWIGVGSPVAQTMWVDDLVLATGPVP